MNQHSFASVIIISTVITLFALNLQNGLACDNDPECGDPTAWSGFNRIELRQSYTGFSDVVEWKASFNHQTNDILINTIANGPDKSINGSIAMVGGRIMLSKDLDLDPGYEIDALDAPVLSIKLLMIALGRVFPNGPDSITSQTNIDKTDKVGIKYATPSASGYIPAPWKIKGMVNKIAKDKVTFDLALTFSAEQGKQQRKTYTMKMQGNFSIQDHAVFLDTDSLEGWKTYGLGPRQIKQETSTIYDYGATPDQETTCKTFGDIRAYIAAENHPGILDTTKDFTGFWKEKCDQAFGLQIMHQGNDGKYSVVFCGPGGCGDPSESRLTFITGDKWWEVVSEDELIQVGRSGERDIYYRCTRETNPVLKY